LIPFPWCFFPLFRRRTQIVPVSEGRRIHQSLQTEYVESNEGGHFLDDTLPGLVPLLARKLAATQ